MRSIDPWLLALAVGACRAASSTPAPPIVPTFAVRAAAPPVLPVVKIAPLSASARLAAGDQGPRTDEDARRAFLARTAHPSIELAPAPKPPHVLSLALEDTARGEASGMTPVTELLFAKLDEGGRATTKLELPPASCTTIVAQGGLGVIEADAFLTLAGDGIVAEDASHGPIAVIGGKGKCVRNEGEGPRAVVLHVVARRGGGTFAARVFRRSTAPTLVAPVASASARVAPGASSIAPSASVAPVAPKASSSSVPSAAPSAPPPR